MILTSATNRGILGALSANPAVERENSGLWRISAVVTTGAIFVPAHRRPLFWRDGGEYKTRKGNKPACPTARFSTSRLCGTVRSFAVGVSTLAVETFNGPYTKGGFRPLPPTPYTRRIKAGSFRRRGGVAMTINPFPFATPEGDPVSREEIEGLIDRLIDVLDALDGDPDLEEGGDHEYDDEREEENEHGGDILDEPHDGGEDDEPFLGWDNPRVGPADTAEGWAASDEADNPVPHGLGGLEFDYSGYRVAQSLLRDLGARRRDISVSIPRRAPALW